MLQASVQILVIIQVLRGSGCQDPKQFDEDITLPANITAQSLQIVDCFTEAVNISGQFSDEQALSVSHFQDMSYPCDRNSWRIFRCNDPLMEYLEEAKYLANESHYEVREFFNTELFRTNEVVHYEKATELRKQAIQVMKELIHQIRQIKEEAAARNEFRIFTDNCSLSFLDMDNLLHQFYEYNTVYDEMRIVMEIWSFRKYTLRYHFLPFLAVVFTFGMLGNGLLLLIFVRHPKTRMGPNVMLVNLAVSDTLFLLFNIAANYCRLLWGFPFGTEACYVYSFVRCLITASSVCSTTILSLMRYIAVTAKPGSSYNRLTSMPLMLTTVWILSTFISMPETLTSTVVRYASHTADCGYDNISSYSIWNFFLVSFLPLIAITSFYIAASRRLRKSVRMMPGETFGQDNVKMARERGAKILPGLILVFAITFLPFYTFWAIVTAFRIEDAEKSLVCHTLYYVVYFLFNLNSALNPVALYLTSGMFRKYINNYITLGMAQKQKSPAGSEKSYTISSRL